MRHPGIHLSWMIVRSRISNRLLELKNDDLIGRGGEGSIYVVDQYREFAAKIYHPENPEQIRKVAERERKIAAMLVNPPFRRGAEDFSFRIAWPVEALVDAYETDLFVGYLLPYIAESVPLPGIYHPDRRLTCLPHFTFSDLLHVALNLTQALREIHAAGHVLGDLNGSNILVDRMARVAVVDTDSFQIRDAVNDEIYRCPVGTAEFSAPELQFRPKLSRIVRTVEQDLFAYAVILFKLLMEGWHPFEGIVRSSRESQTLAENIRRGYFPYSLNRSTAVQPEPSSPQLDMLHPHLQLLFVQCFETGHYAPSRRPGLDAWTLALDDALASLAECVRNPRHLFSDHLLYCPWCERKKFHMGLDLFPSLEEEELPD